MQKELIKNIKISSFKSSENIQKKEGGPDRSSLYFYRLFWRKNYFECIFDRFEVQVVTV